MAAAFAGTFDGLFLFGEAVCMMTGDPEREVQFGTYFGLNGISSINGGSRGRRTTVRGLLVANDLAAYNVMEGFFYAYLNAGNFTLVDTQGRTWPQVRLTSFSPEGERLKQDWVTGEVVREYTAVFSHQI
jgi:hypothetical protein